MDRERSPAEVLEIVRRRLGLVVASALVALAAASAVSLVLPKVYRVESKIEIQPVGLAGREAAEKINASKAQITSHHAFEEVSKVLDLDAPFRGMPEAQRLERTDAMLTSMQNATQVDVEQPAATVWTIDITHSARDPDLALRVVTELSNYYSKLVYDQPTEEQHKIVEGARKGEEDAKQQLEATTAAHTQFRDANREFISGAPERQKRLEDELRELDDVKIATEEQHRKDTQAALEGETEFKETKEHQADSNRLTGLDKDIRETKALINRLVVIEGKTEEHPAVIAARQLLKQQEEDYKRIEDEAPERTVRIPNPMYTELRKELSASVMKLNELRNQRRKVSDDIRDAKQEVAKTPDIQAKEKQFAEDEAAARKTFDARHETLQKEQAKLEDLKHQGQLTVRPLNPPERPRTPSGPGPFLLALAGLVLGLAFGVGAAFVLAGFDHSFREMDAVAAFLGVPTLGAIHNIQTPAEAAQRRAKRRRNVAVLAGLAVVAGATFAVAVLGNVHAVSELMKG